jgi:hypothetical protein
LGGHCFALPSDFIGPVAVFAAATAVQGLTSQPAHVGVHADHELVEVLPDSDAEPDDLSNDYDAELADTDNQAEETSDDSDSEGMPSSPLYANEATLPGMWSDVLQEMCEGLGAHNKRLHIRIEKMQTRIHELIRLAGGNEDVRCVHMFTSYIHLIEQFLKGDCVNFVQFERRAW